MFNTLVASNVGTRPRVRSGLIALFLHVAIVLGAISATATSRAVFQPAARDTIRLDLTRLRSQPQRSSPAAPPNGTAQIPGPPPPALAAPPDIPALEPSPLAGSPVDLRALVGVGPNPVSGPVAGPEPAPPVLPGAEVDVLPQLTGGLQSHYPEGLRRAGVSGEVLLEYVVEKSGRVDSSSVRILQRTHPAFSAAVLDALRGVRFRPARRSGRPVAVLVRQTIRFEIR